MGSTSISRRGSASAVLDQPSVVDNPSSSVADAQSALAGDRGADLRCRVLAVALTGAAFFLAMPFGPVAFLDDWSYAFIARRFAESGTMHYVGWSAAMLLVQVPYGALLIRLFGFSFDLLRLGTLPFAAGCALLIYGFLRRASLTPSESLLGALTVTLSPVAMPLTASFMSDIYGCFFILLSLHCGLRATESRSESKGFLWLVLACLVGFAGGANRQIAWVAPVACLLHYAFIKRSKRVWVAGAGGLFLALCLAIALLMQWYQAQPSAQFFSLDKEAILPVVQRLRGVLLAGRYLLWAVLFALPALILKWPWKGAFSIGDGALAAMVAAIWGWGSLHFPRLRAPWLGNMVTTQGIADGEVMLGERPELFPASVQIAIAMLVLFVVTLCSLLCVRKLIALWPGGLLQRLQDPSGYLSLWIPFVLGYVALALAGPTTIDRYIIPVLPFSVLGGMLLLRSFGNARNPVLGWLSLAFLAAFGIATTHDYHALTHANQEAFNRLRSSGVPAHLISAGYEIDGWTQLTISGQVRNCTAQPPSGGPGCDQRPYHPLADDYWFLYLTSSLDPAYFVTRSRDFRLGPPVGPPIPVQAWLPPLRQPLLVQPVRGRRPAEPAN